MGRLPGESDHRPVKESQSAPEPSTVAMLAVRRGAGDVRADTFKLSLLSPVCASPDPSGFLEGVFENAPVALEVRAADGCRVLANRRFRDLFGNVGPGEGDLDELVRRAACGRTIHVAPRWYPANASTRVWAVVTLFPFPDRDGRVAHVALCFEDLTEQLERERALEALVRESEARAAILDEALDCVITMDATGRVTHFNAAAEQTFGYTRSEAIGRPLAELVVPPRLRAAHHDGLARYLATGEGPILKRRIELTAMRADGVEFPVELIVVPVGSDGPPAFTGFMRDLTERKEVEKALVRSEARFRTLSDAGILGIITADIHGGILEANEAFLQMVGRTPEEVRAGHLRWADITPPEWRSLDDRAVDQLLETGVASPGRRNTCERTAAAFPFSSAW